MLCGISVYFGTAVVKELLNESSGSLCMGSLLSWCFPLSNLEYILAKNKTLHFSLGLLRHSNSHNITETFPQRPRYMQIYLTAVELLIYFGSVCLGELHLPAPEGLTG